MLINHVDTVITKLSEELSLELTEVGVLFKLFNEETNEIIDELNKHVSDKNYDMLQRVVHNIKGISANLCLTDINLLSQKIDLSLKAHAEEKYDEVINDLIYIIKQTQDELIQFYAARGINLMALEE